jgi:Icc-related predicted phosphoesterase
MTTMISVVAISDTHSQQDTLPKEWPPADIFLHAGDITRRGTKVELEAAVAWLGSLPYEHKIVIAGNHDIGLDKTCTYRDDRVPLEAYPTREETDEIIASMKDTGITYLTPENPSVEILIRDSVVKIYGLPYSARTPRNPAFAYDRARDPWTVLPCEYDIILIHGPPKGHLDLTRRGEHAGCEHLLQALRRTKPRVALWGHIHEARGQETVTWDDGSVTRLFNVAILNLDKTVGPVTMFELEDAKEKGGWIQAPGS